VHPHGIKPKNITLPAPATNYTRIREEASRQTAPQVALTLDYKSEEGLPSERELAKLFDHYNWVYWGGKLPRVRVEYSTRMTSAGSYSPHRKLIRIGRKYHELFPEDLHDTLKHEMIHIIHLNHGPKFKAEARRVGATRNARSHPTLRRPPRYIYACPGCGHRYERQKRLVMASCGDCSKGGSFDPRFKLRLIQSNPPARR
jgi:predicted SprT family Zn-dependent metalloprotease